MELISSVKNPRVLAWRSLQDRKGRDAQNAFLVEGVRMVREALQSDFDLQAVLLREDFEPPFPLPEDVPAFVLSAHAFASVTETKTPATETTSFSPTPLNSKMSDMLLGQRNST